MVTSAENEYLLSVRETCVVCNYACLIEREGEREREVFNHKKRKKRGEKWSMRVHELDEKELLPIIMKGNVVCHCDNLSNVARITIHV